MPNIPRAGLKNMAAVHIIHSTNMTPETGSGQRKYALAILEASPPVVSKIIFQYLNLLPIAA